jgi:hypothetical protein
MYPYVGKMKSWPIFKNSLRWISILYGNNCSPRWSKRIKRSRKLLNLLSSREKISWEIESILNFSFNSLKYIFPLWWRCYFSLHIFVVHTFRIIRIYSGISWKVHFRNSFIQWLNLWMFSGKGGFSFVKVLHLKKTHQMSHEKKTLEIVCILIK